MLRTSVHVDGPMPDGSPGGWFSTQDAEDGPFWDLRLSHDGRLCRDIVRSEEGEMPPAGSSAALAAFLSRGRLRREGEEQIAFHGFLCLRDGERRYTARFRHGIWEGTRVGGLESWATPGLDRDRVIADLLDIFSPGRNPVPSEVRAFLNAVISSPGQAEDPPLVQQI